MILEEFLKEAEENWTREEINTALRSLRDIRLRKDKQRELTHTIYSSNMSASISATLKENSETVELTLTTTGAAALDKEMKVNNTLTTLSLNKTELKDLVFFLSYLLLEPKET